MAIKFFFSFFLILFFSNLISAAELTINLPSEVNLNEEFTVLIDADLSEQFDVKIFVHSSSDEQISRSEYISEIYNLVTQEWKDSWFYIGGTFPETKSYSLKVIESPGERNICLRLRKTGSQTSYIKCQSINIKGEQENNSGDDEESNENEEEQETENNEQENNQEQENNSQEQNSNIEQNSQPLSYTPKIEQKQEKIILNQPQEKINDNLEITKEEKIRKWLVYGFLFFTVFLLILIGLRKL